MCVSVCVCVCVCVCVSRHQDGGKKTTWPLKETTVTPCAHGGGTFTLLEGVPDDWKCKHRGS